MKRALAVIGAGMAVLCTACAPMYGAHSLARRQAAHAVQAPAPALVTGRWDNVMMLPPGAALHVLLADGRRAEGTIASASMSALRLVVAAGEVEFNAADVIRVDRLPQGADGRVRDAASGALHGAGVVGLLGLIAGRVPPARLFAAGAIGGADIGYHARPPAGAQTIYLSPGLGR